ncbi:MAG: histidine kinase [Actinoplanes sp.]
MTRRYPLGLVPAVLCAVQLAIWPVVPLAVGGAIEPVTLVAGLAVIAAVTVVLFWRRRAPLAVTGALVVVLSLGAWVLPDYELSAVTIADLIAFFNVALFRSRRTTLLVGAGLVLWQAVLIALTEPVDGWYPLSILASVVAYALVAAFGRQRARWHADRAAAARRLVEAETARHQAADAERHRLARELHDVTAHHLTAIVVNSSAAQMLGDQRPELRGEALGFAARTGWDTLAALRRLVAVMPYGQQAEELTDLADGFRRLGQQVTLDAPATPLPPAVAEAVHGIAREALTNTLRYAAGGTIQVTLRHTEAGTELVVDDDGASSAAQPGAGLGGGRGLTGMRERAQALGGVLEAGPRAGGGWRVRAVLPSSVPVPAAPARRVRQWLRSEVAVDAVVVLGALLMPVAVLIGLADEDGLAAAPFTLLLLGFIAHAAPLMWRRRHPWPVLGTVAATAWAGPLLVATHAVPAGDGWIFLFTVGAEFAVAYAVAVYGGRPAVTWLAPLLASASAAAALGLLVALDPSEEGAGPFLVLAAFTGVFVGVVLLPFVAGTWAGGIVARTRRQNLLSREHGAVAMVTAQAIAQARDERARVAAGLHHAVLEHAGRVPQAAEHGDLAAVLASARAALAAMRALLAGLREPPADAVAPQPTLASLGARLRAAGHDVAVDLAAAGPVPTAVDLTACRVAELLLTDPVGRAEVRVDRDGDTVRVVVTGGRPPAGDAAAELRARIGALGGRMAVSPDGTVTVRLGAPAEELTAS